MADEHMEVAIARLDERLKSIERMLGEIGAAQKEASEGRRRGYEAQERTEREVIGINHRLSAVEKSVEAIRSTTAELEKVHDRVRRLPRQGNVGPPQGSAGDRRWSGRS